MRIYVIYNYGQYNHLIYRMLRDLGVEARLIENSTPPEEIDADGLVIGGGPSMGKSGRSADYVRELDIPVLGICLGHQIIAKVFGGKVGRGEVGGYAENEVRILKEDDLFVGFPERIRVWESHMDEVKEMPDNFELLATSSICEIEAMKHKKRPIYGVQWHPEVYHSEYGEELYKNFIEVCRE